MQRDSRFSLLLLLSFVLLCFVVIPVAGFGQMLSYSSYLNTGYGSPALTGPIAVNATGETCVFGPTALSELRNDGSVIYSVSNLYSGNFLGFVAIDAQGNCYVVSTGTITPTAGAFQTAPKAVGISSQFVVKVNGSGSVVYATYLGGSGTDSPGGIAVDGSGNVYVTGQTRSNDYPTLNAFQPTIATAPDAYITALNATGTALLYSTYWGGNSADGGVSIAVDAASNAYIAGQTASSNFPTVAPFQASPAGQGSAFAIKLDATGTPVYSTYLGGSGGSTGVAITADANGSAYVAGNAGTGFPLVNPIQSSALGVSAFISKFSPDGSALVYSTYLGESTTAIAVQVDSAGQAYLAGDDSVNETSQNIPIVSPIQSDSVGGEPQSFADTFVSVVSASGASVLFSSWLGGYSDTPNGLGIDSAGSIYLSLGAIGPVPIVNAANGVYLPLVTDFGTVLTPEQFLVSKIVLSAGPSLSYPTTVDLRDVPIPVGSSINDVTVLLASTSATVDVAISNIAINGDFSQTNNCPQTPQTLLAATSCQFQVIFTPPQRDSGQEI